MGKITFRYFDREQPEKILSQMFDVLFTNMSAIAPTGNSYHDDKQIWMSYMTSEMGKRHQIILMYTDETLAGYFQYCVTEDTVLIEEIEILPEYQRTFLFYYFFKQIRGEIPDNIRYVEAYINKANWNSMKIAKKLGMEIIGENRTGKSWHYRGEMKDLKKWPR